MSWLFRFLQSGALGRVISRSRVPLAAPGHPRVPRPSLCRPLARSGARRLAGGHQLHLQVQLRRSLPSRRGWVRSLNRHALCFPVVRFRSGIIKHQSKLYCCGYGKIRTLSRTSGSNKFVLYLISYLSQCQYETTSFYYFNCT